MTNAGRYGREVMARSQASGVGDPSGIPRGRVPRHRADEWIAAVVTLFTLSGAAIVGAAADEPDLGPLPALILLGQVVPLVWRRRSPVTVWALTSVAAGVYGLGHWPDPLVPLGPIVALATVVECRTRPVAALVWASSAVAAAVGLVLSGDSDAVDVWVAVVSLVAAPLIGDWQRARTAHLRQLRLAATRAEADRRRDMEDARRAERTHLARELHDVVAHHVAMMVVQAEAGAAAAEVDGATVADARDALDGIGATGREALDELRRMLAILRAEGTPAPTAPQPGLDDIAELVTRVRASGIDVGVEVTGPARTVPPAVALSAYRVVQEGLTNVVKHAGPTHASVSLRYDVDGIEVAVLDDGAPSGQAPTPDDGPGPGHGIDGLRERVSLLHGRLHAAPRAGGGYELRARMPTA